MNDRVQADSTLSDYLNEHLLASEGGLRAFHAARRTWEGSPHESTFTALIDEVAHDRRVLARLILRLGFRPAPWKRVLTGVARTVGELNPVNLLRRRGGSMGQLEIDVLIGMVRTKLAMWDALVQLAEHDDRLEIELMHDLSKRAQDQIDTLQRVSVDSLGERFQPRTT